MEACEESGVAGTVGDAAVVVVVAAVVFCTDDAAAAAFDPSATVADGLAPVAPGTAGRATGGGC